MAEPTISKYQEDRLKVINWISLILVIIGALNWGMVGFFNLNVLALIFKSNVVIRVIYAIIGIAGLKAFTFFPLFSRLWHKHRDDS